MTCFLSNLFYQEKHIQQINLNITLFNNLHIINIYYSDYTQIITIEKE